MEWFIVGFFLYIIMLAIVNWIKLTKTIKESNCKVFDKVLWNIVLDTLTIIVFTVSVRKICFTLITLNIL